MLQIRLIISEYIATKGVVYIIILDMELGGPRRIRPTKIHLSR